MALPRLALLIDAETIPARHFPFVREHIARLGETRIARIFGDFTDPRLTSWVVHARTHGLETMLQLAAGAGSSDMAVAVEAMDILHGGGIDGMCLASAGRDLTPLAQRLRAGQMDVFGFGLETADVAYRAVCTEFHLLPKAEELPVRPALVRSSKAAAEARKTAGPASLRVVS